MWLHIVLAAGTAVLAGLVVLSKIPGQKILSAREWKWLLLLLAVGNALGAWMTHTQNRDRQWREEMYFEKQPAGEGSYEREMQVNIQGETFPVYVRIPEQEGSEEEERQQETAAPTPGLSERIEQAISVYNQEKSEPDCYYLPTSLDGKAIVWTQPWDTSGAVLTALCVVGACCIPIQKQRAREQMQQKRLRQMLLDYPGLITRLALLIEAGMTVRRAFEKIALDYKRKKENARYAYEELLKSYYEMEAGIMEEQAYENFAKRCGHPKYRTLSALLIQNLKKGNRQLLDILEKESAEAFEERKRYARVQGEAAATKLLIPMVLMLFIVLIILIVPACISFYQM